MVYLWYRWCIALNIKNSEVERLAGEVAALARESKTEAIRRALLERKERLQVSPRSGTRAERLESLLRHRIWPQVPADVLGHSISKQEEEEILGFGPHGV